MLENIRKNTLRERKIDQASNRLNENIDAGLKQVSRIKSKAQVGFDEERIALRTMLTLKVKPRFNI